MAKKKGTRNRKKSTKKSSGKKKKKEEKPAEVAEEEKAEPEVGDAVSEVIGKKEEKKSEKKIPKKYNKLLLQWTADGYDVKELEELVEIGSPTKIRSEFKKYEDAIAKTEEIKSALEDMDAVGLDNEIDELTDLLMDPKNYKEAGAQFEILKKKKRALDLKAELGKMVLPAMKGEVAKLKERLVNLNELDAIEKQMAELKVKYKESYFEEGILSQVKGKEAPPPPTTGEAPKKAAVKSGATPMVVKDIFLLYKDGRFISHHTSRPVSKEEQTQLFADLKTGRNYLRSPKYVPQKLNAIKAEDRSIVVQSGKFTVVIMIAEGDVNPWTERIVTKVLTLMEKEDVAELRDWNGDVASLKSSGKYMQALLFACMKLAKKK